MHVAERILLYVFAAAFAVQLVLDKAGKAVPAPDRLPERPVVVGKTPGEGTGTDQETAPGDPKPHVQPAAAGGGEPGFPAPGETAPRPVNGIVTDAQGKTRIRMGVTEQGTPQLAFLNANGMPILELIAGESGGEIRLQNASGSMRLQLADDGGGLISIGPEASPLARITVSAAGVAEVAVRSRQQEQSEALLRTDETGGAEVAVRHAASTGYASMSVVPSGDLGVRLMRDNGPITAGMQLLSTGEAEINIIDARNESGPSMLYGADRVSILGTRVRGRPAASIISAVNEQSLVVVQNSKSNRQALIMIDPAGKTFIGERVAKDPPPEGDADPNAPRTKSSEGGGADAP
jgi:hypothetical protein